MRAGKKLLDRAWSVAYMEKNVSASESAIDLVESLTKQFTAALVLKRSIAAARR